MSAPYNRKAKQCKMEISKREIVKSAIIVVDTNSSISIVNRNSVKSKKINK